MANENGNGKLRISPSVLAQIAIWLVSVLLAYGALSTRIAVVEDRVQRFGTDISEIKADIKTLLRRGND